MTKRQLARALVLVTLVFVGVCALARDGSSPLTKEERDAFAWFDSLGFPDLKDAKLVRVRIQQAPTHKDGTFHVPFFLAFLLSEDEKGFTIFANLETKRIERAGSLRTFGDAVATYEALAPEKAIAEVLEESRHGVTHRAVWLFEIRGQAFVLARGLARMGHEDLAHDLCRKILGMHDRSMNAEKGGPTGLRAIAERDIARALVAYMNINFEQPDLSRKQILASAEHYLERFPSSEHDAWVKDVATRLHAMVGEDEEHANTPRALAPPTEAERIRELIFRLRDQDDIWLPSFDVGLIGSNLYGPWKHHETALHDLAALGTAAVPQLIDALDDRRFTRSVQHYNMESNIYPKEIILVGEAVLKALEAISGRRFCEHAFPKDAERPLLRGRVQEWWDKYRRLGDLAYKIDLVESGHSDAIDAAWYLLEKHPEIALEPIVKGARAADPSTRTYLVGIAVIFTGEAPVPFLLDEVKNGTRLPSRFMAAIGLDERRRPEGVAMVASLWRNGIPDRDLGGWMGVDREKLAGFLVTSQLPEGVEVIAETLPTMSQGTHVQVFSQLRLRRTMPEFAEWHRGFRTLRDWNQSDASLAVVERLLLHELENTEQIWPWRCDWDDVWTVDPRVSDLAAYLLHQRWPDRYEFDFHASSKDRERQRLAIVNRERLKRRFPPVPTPPEPEPLARLARDRADALLRDATQTSDESLRRHAIASLESHGLAALPAVRERLKTLGQDDPSRSALEAVARRSSVIVRKASADTESGRVPAPIGERLDAMTSKPLAPGAVQELLATTFRHRPHVLTRVRLEVLREGDDTGVELRLTLVTGTPSSDKTWGWSVSLVHEPTDEKVGDLPRSFGSSISNDYAETAEAHKEVREVLEHLIGATRAGEHFSMRVALVGP